MSNCFPILVSKCVDAIKADEESGNIAISSLCDLIEAHPKFMRPILGDLVNIFTEIMESNMGSSLRIKAANGIYILGTTSPANMRKNDTMKARTLPAFMKMMSEVEVLEIDEWNAELKDEVLSKNDPSSAAQEALGKMAGELGVKYLLP